MIVSTNDNERTTNNAVQCPLFELWGLYVLVLRRNNFFFEKLRTHKIIAIAHMHSSEIKRSYFVEWIHAT